MTKKKNPADNLGEYKGDPQAAFEDAKRDVTSLSEEQKKQMVYADPLEAQEAKKNLLKLAQDIRMGVKVATNKVFYEMKEQDHEIGNGVKAKKRRQKTSDEIQWDDLERWFNLISKAGNTAVQANAKVLGIRDTEGNKDKEAEEIKFDWKKFQQSGELIPEKKKTLRKKLEDN